MLWDLFKKSNGKLIYPWFQRNKMTLIRNEDINTETWYQDFYLALINAIQLI